MNDNLKQLIRYLADGKFHSGGDIGHALGISRSAIWKHTKSFADLGLHLESVTGKGYRLQQPLDFLDYHTLTKQLIPATANTLKSIDLFDTLDSTNDYLLSRVYETSKMPRVCLSEHQSAGKGRRGRRWFAPYAQNIYCSTLWPFMHGDTDLHGLSLAIGVAVCQTLEQLGVTKGLGIKWPNDVMLQDQKLAGILCEIRGEVNTRYMVVIGIGINVHMLTDPDGAISQPFASILKNTQIHLNRNLLAATLLNQLTATLKQFQQTGLSPFLADFKKRDALYNKPLRFLRGDNIIEGTGDGINTQGLLRIKQADDQIIQVNSGEVATHPA